MVWIEISANAKDCKSSIIVCLVKARTNIVLKNAHFVPSCSSVHGQLLFQFLSFLRDNIYNNFLNNKWIKNCEKKYLEKCLYNYLNATTLPYR